MFIWIWLAVASAIAYLWLKKKFSHFKDQDVHHLPWMSAFRSLVKMFTKQEHFLESIDRIYKHFPNDRFVGSYQFTTPLIFVRDPELVRLIGVKDFDHFLNHQAFSNQNDIYFSKSLIGLKGQKWRDMRATLSPAFTGSKLRNMVPLIEECNNNLLDYLHQEITQNPDKYLDVDAEDLVRRYANDVIATSAFGIKINSVKEKENEFYVMGRKMTNFSMKQVFKSMLVLIIPFITKVIKINILPLEAAQFLKHIVLSSFRDRDERNIFRPDMIQLLLEARKGTLTHDDANDENDAGFATVEESSVGKNTVKRVWDDDDLIAQAFLFFFAGFETVSIAIKFLLSEVALDSDIQDRLRQEIDDHYEKYGEKLGYDKINQMKYLDMVVSETLRKWPPGVSTDRQCNKPYNLGRPHGSTEKKYTIKDKETLQIPIWSFHRDSKYYDNPEKFNPDRFSEENKHDIKPFTYMPFGIGPRNCIASRFALVEVKVMACGLLRRFEVSPGPDAKVPLQLDRGSFSLRADGGHSLRFKCRK